jgi:predicted nuclease of predicted toxin-antitoxin system
VALRLYLDECAQSGELRDRLRAAGHDVVTALEAGLTHRPDGEQLAFAIRNDRILLTKNPADFLAMHRGRQHRGEPHPGIFAVCQDNDPSRDMTSAEIVKAVANVEEAFGAAGLANQFIYLNQYRY